MLITPVYLSYRNGKEEILTYALIDSMADRSYISRELVQRMDVSQADITVKDPLTLYTLAEPTTVDCELVSGLRVRGYDQNYMVNLPMMTTTKNEIPINRKHIPTKDMADRWKHLRCISDKLPPPMNLDAGLVLGANCNPDHMPLEIVAASPEEPYTRRTVLGWSVTGTDNGSTNGNRGAYSHRVMTKEVQDNTLSRHEVMFFTDPSTPTPQQIPDVLESDFQPTKEELGMSMDDRLFMTIMTHEIYQDNVTGHVTMPLPFKQRPQGFGQATKKAAEHRFNLLIKRFKTNSEYETQYKAFMKSIIENGDAEEVNDNEENAWYIPHFGVFHPKKPDKIRVVFDCAAKSQGKSLNDFLLPGPDLMNSLLGILMRFRQKRIALSCDIEWMFHQFHVKTGDRDYLRFLWFDESGTKTVYRMKVHLFGAKSSPACATFGLRYLAETHEENTPAHQFIATNFYVDDGLTCTDDLTMAVALIQQATSLCHKGNIRLHKFVSNSQELIQAIPETERSSSTSEIDLPGKNDALHRTLGIQRNTSNDSFCYDLTMKSKDMTRRGLLSAVASTFDPLGLISPILITRKTILQKSCQLKLNWDDRLPEDLSSEWIS